MNHLISDPEQLIPHRKPMLLLDEVLQHDIEMTKAKVTIKKSDPFYSTKQCGVPIWAGVEYMAQTIGVWDGAMRLAEQSDAQIAFLLGVRNYSALPEKYAVFKENAELIITVIPALYDKKTGQGVFDCTIDCDDLHITARLNAFSPREKNELIQEMI